LWRLSDFFRLPWAKQKEDAKLRAEILLNVHGKNAANIARSKAIDSQQKIDWQVLRLVEKRLGIVRKVDTATRYLEAEKEHSKGKLN
jgi:hypothetical protein